MPPRPGSPFQRFIHQVASAQSAAERTDGQLLEEFASHGDETAFGALLRRHGSMVLGVCRGILHDRHDAEDAFQATFLVLVRRAGAIGKRESVGSWLHGVAYRLAMRARSEVARRRRRERAVRPPPAEDPLADVVWRDLRPVLHEEVNRLPAKYQAPIVLCYLEGRTNEEAARLLGWPKGTVLSRLARARERLRVRLTRRGLGVASVLAAVGTRSAPAAVPPTLIQATREAARSYAAKSAAAGVLSVTIRASADGMLRSLFLARLVKAVLGGVVVLTVGTAAGALSLRQMAAEQNPPHAARTVAIAPAGAARPPSPEAPANDRHDYQKLLQGTWVVTAGEQHGEAVPEVEGDRLILKNDHFTMFAYRGEVRRLFRRGVTEGAFRLDPARPEQIDLVEDFGLLRGIFSLAGDTLTLCVGDPDVPDRPEALQSAPKDRRLLLTLQRQPEEENRP